MKKNSPVTHLANLTLRLMLLASLLATLGLGFLPEQAVQAAAVLYAKPDGMISGTCADWTHACNLQYILSSPISDVEVWAKAGTYKPTTNSNRSIPFILSSGVAIYGGFAGTETSRSQRNPATHVTILSGDIGGTGHNDNSYHVVVAGSDVDETAILDGFTITAGNANGSGDDNEGGGMYNDGSPTLTGVTFSSNSAASYGGGMYNDGSPTLTSVTFSANTADQGGGIYNDYYGYVTLTDVTFSQNHATGSGGGMDNFDEGGGTLSNVTFSGNTVYSGSGGGLYMDYGSFTMSDVTFSNNSATGSGGGMFIGGSPSTTLTNGIFSDNSADSGGGLSGSKYCSGESCSNSFVTLADVTFNDNHATSSGGGIYNDGVFSLTGVTFNGNSAGTEGGGIDNEEDLSLTDVTFSANTADQGGGLYNIGFSTGLSNVTFSGNSAASYGGGLCSLLGSDDSLSLTNITFSSNSANQGGGIFNWQGSPSIHDSILWGNTAGGGGAQIYNYDGGSTPTITYSDVQGGCPAGSTCSHTINLNPFLGSLGDYGGGTQVFPLLPGSPAIDAGNNSSCAFFDQRGISRPQGAHCDMGAFESQGFTLTITSGSPQITRINTAFPAPLALSVTSASSEPVNGGQITFTAPASGARATLSSNSATITGGKASVTATANGVVGTYTVTANASGVASLAVFSLTNSLNVYRVYLPLTIH